MEEALWKSLIEPLVQREFAEEEGREDRSPPFGVGLESACNLAATNRKPDDVHGYRRNGRDQKHDVHAARGLRSYELCRPAVAVAFEISERLLDLHAHPVDVDDDARRIAEGRNQKERLASRVTR